MWAFAKAEELLFNLSARDLVLDIHRDYYKLYSIRQYLNNLEQDYSINLAQLVESENKYKTFHFQSTFGQKTLIFSVLREGKFQLLAMPSTVWTEDIGYWLYQELP